MFGTLVDTLMGCDDAAITERFRELELQRWRMPGGCGLMTVI
jgi:hypothetical protein